MAFLGVQGSGGSNESTKLANTLAEAFFGDAETELKMAKIRQDMESEAWRRRVWEAQAAANQATADTTGWELQQRQQNLPTVQDFYGGLVEQPAPVEVPDTPIPVPTARPSPVPIDLTPTGDAAADLGRAVAAQQDMPVAVDPNAGIMPQATGKPLAAGAAAPAPQVLPGPQPDIPVTPEQQAAYQREVEARRAEAALIVGGGGTANQMAQGLGIGEGIIKSGSQDPRTAAQGALLYTGQPGAVGGDLEIVQKLRKEFEGTPEFQKWSIANSGYQNMRGAMNTLAQITDQADPRRGPADMRLLYNYLKMLDPNTGVKEGEYSSAREAGGPWAQIWNLYDGTISGAVLDNATRAAFMKEGTNIYNIASEGLRPHVEKLASEARRYNIDPNRVVTEPTTAAEYTSPIPEGSGITEDMINQQIDAALPRRISRDQALMLLLAARQGQGQ